MRFVSKLYRPMYWNYQAFQAISCRSQRPCLHKHHLSRQSSVICLSPHWSLSVFVFSFLLAFLSLVFSSSVTSLPVFSFFLFPLFPSLVFSLAGLTQVSHRICTPLLSSSLSSLHPSPSLVVLSSFPMLSFAVYVPLFLSSRSPLPCLHYVPGSLS